MYGIQGRCTQGNCVQVETVPGGVRLTSTIVGNDGAVFYTNDEWDAFVARVKAGELDGTVTASVTTPVAA